MYMYVHCRSTQKCFSTCTVPYNARSIAALILRVSILRQAVEPLWSSLDGRLLWILQREVGVPAQLKVEVGLVTETGHDRTDDL